MSKESKPTSDPKADVEPKGTRIAPAPAEPKISEQAAAKLVAPTEIIDPETGEVMTLITPLKKLSLGEMNINGSHLIKGMEKGDVRVVARIYGVSDEYRRAPSRFGTLENPKDDVRFKGKFEGVNLIDGGVYQARYCYLPDLTTDMLVDAIDGMGDDVGVQFEAEFAIKKIVRADGSDHWKFTARMPSKAQSNDPLRQLRSRMARLPVAYSPTGEPKQLSAPAGKELTSEQKS